MDQSLKDQLDSSMMRFRKVGMIFPMGIHMGEFMALNLIAKCSVDGRVNLSDLQNSLHVTKPAISQMFNTLEKKGYVRREVDLNDRRKISVTLTPEGEVILDRTREFSEKTFSEVLSRFGEDNTRQFIGLFNLLIDIAEDLKQEYLQEKAGDNQID
jgi:DNA-binding MarR family transcriptional regulator